MHEVLVKLLGVPTKAEVEESLAHTVNSVMGLVKILENVEEQKWPDLSSIKFVEERSFAEDAERVSEVFSLFDSAKD